ncbi:MAG: hypothetical protein EAX96_20810 [Candidatus Lokiarchaeota archaeon]|nr:hypothetical protein [Candidatus Lokiarchaeota archaeon]
MRFKKYKTKKKWKLRCFACGQLVSKYPEYYKFWSGAYCLPCGEEIEVNAASFEYETYQEEQARKKGWSEEKEYEDALLRKYGEI